MIEILTAGALTTVQDLGRPGYAHLGVGNSGAADRPSLRLANRLVGNRENAACLEISFGGLAARFHRPGTIALTGATGPVRISGRNGFVNGPIPVHAGDEVQVGVPTRGVRTYLAIRGGVDVPPVLGSRPTDVLAGLGPEPLRAGMRLAVGDEVERVPCVDVAPVAPIPDEIVVRALPGPRDDWFTPAALHTLASQAYQVTLESNRVGVRLSGHPLERVVTGELPSEGMVTGALQVPPNGQPVLFLADHPVTGGYPVIAVVREVDVALAAQARPGQTVRFRVMH